MTTAITGQPTGFGRLAVVTYEALGLGDRSYLVHDGRKAMVVDPQRSPEPYLSMASSLGLDIELVLETHVHNDYVSGGLALSRRTGAVYGVPAGEPVAFAAESRALVEGDVLIVGRLSVKVLSTPGHTPHHLSYWAADGSGPGVVLTGGSLLAGSTGRTDLLGPGQASALAAAQWRSVRRVLDELPPSTVVLPTHGFGSFCASGPAVDQSEGQLTIGLERGRNPAANLDRAAFVHSLTADPLPVPTYYQYMAPLNRAGAVAPVDAHAVEVAPGLLAGLLAEGAAVVDLRHRRDFARDHWRGALNMALGPNLVTYLGWLLPYDASLVLIAPTLETTVEASRLLASIGREKLFGWVPAELVKTLSQGQRGEYAVAAFDQLAERSSQVPPPTVIDVRFPHEWRAGHIAGAVNVPLPEVSEVLSGSAGTGAADARDRVTDADGAEIWVHCAGGSRAGIAASWLSGRGIRPVLVDDGFENAALAGLRVVTGSADLGESEHRPTAYK